MWILDHELSGTCATEYYDRGRYPTITQYTSSFPLLRLARAHVPRQIILLRRRVCGELVWGANHIQLGVILNPL